jgi:hypothetical protein
MSWVWTNGPQLSILLHHDHAHDYAAEVSPSQDESTSGTGYNWTVYRDNKTTEHGWNAIRHAAKREAEAALAALIGLPNGTGENE